MKNIFLIILSIALLTSCKTAIDLKFSDEFSPALVVEGYVTQNEPISTVRLTTTKLYSDPNPNPAATNVDYVILKRTDSLGNVSSETLTPKSIGSADYVSSGLYTPQLGDLYELEIKFKGEIFKSSSKINRPVIVDSISSFYQPKAFGTVEGYQINYAARDLKGKGEYFFFEKLKNGNVYSESLNDMFNIWDDQVSDGLTFPPPVVFNLNPQPNTEKNTYVESAMYPYAIGDTVVIKAYSIDEKAYRFYFDLISQNTSAQGGALGPLFASPMDNVRTNLYNTNKNGIKVQGLFSARGLNAVGIRIKADK